MSNNTTKYCLLRLCLALRGDKQSHNPSDEDRDMVTKDCITIWEKEGTIENAFHDVIKGRYE
jgi:hypothetical protein